MISPPKNERKVMIEKFIKERKLDVSPYTNANNDLMSLTSQAMGFSKNRIKLD